MFDYADQYDPHSRPIIIAAIRDLFLIAESYLINNIMLKTADNKQQTEIFHVDELMSSLRDTNRDIQDVLKNIEYLQNNISDFQSLTNETQHELAERTATRLAQLRNEAVIIKDYQLAYEIENIFENIGLT